MSNTESYPYVVHGKQVRFFYLRDPSDRRRVATFARILVGTELFYAWSINRFSPSRYSTDNFTKSRGREIAFGRLKHARSRREIELSDDKSPISTMLEDVVSGPVVEIKNEDDFYNGLDEGLESWDDVGWDDMGLPIYGEEDVVAASVLRAPKRLVHIAKRGLAEYRRNREQEAERV